MPTPEIAEELTIVEARILGVLIEKEKTTPDVYPLTLNSLSAGCNQKTARDPVFSLNDCEIQAALENLRRRVLVIESYGASGRVLRYAQNFGKVYGLPAASVALLATLILQTAVAGSAERRNASIGAAFRAISGTAEQFQMGDRPSSGILRRSSNLANFDGANCRF